MSEQYFAELCDYIEQRMAHYHVPGVAVGVHYQGQEFTNGFGVTNVDHPLPVDEHTKFQVGSISKTVTGTAVMRLVEKGDLDLDLPVRQYVPDFKMADEDVAAQVTLRHLLNHTGGWAGDYFSETGNGDDALVIYVREMADLPQLTPLGSLWTYNNSGFGLAGRIIEVVTGQTYEQAVTGLVLQPLGMHESFFFPQDVMTYAFVSGHFSEEEDPAPFVARPWALARSAHSAGGVIASVIDLLRYARFHMGDGTAEDGTRILSAQVLAEMQTPTVDANLGSRFGITWFVKEVDGLRLVRHGGATRGQMATFLMVPEKEFAITILTNSDHGGYLNDETVKWTLKQYLGLQEDEPEPQPRTPQELAPYVGEYDAQLGLITLVLEGDELVAHYTPHGGFPDKDSPPAPAPPPTRVAFTGPDEIIDLDPPHTGSRAEFIRDENGQIRWLRTSRLHKRL